jgi:toxin-antitoxin system PIN domain toxin
MTAFLLDVNVLVALSWPEHQFHNNVQRWFGRNAERGWATCPFVQAGFVRILSNPKFSARAVSPKEAIEALTVTVRHPRHEFWADDIPVAGALGEFGDRIVGHQQVTDAYLLALAKRRRGKLATLDRRLGGLAGEKPQEAVVEVIG